MTRADLSKVQRPLRILFVCSGNTCRSPLAEALARRIAPTVGLTQVEARSAGTSTIPGLPASGGARRVAAYHGLDLGSHRSSPLSGELLEWADLILTMAPAHLHRVLELGGGSRADLLGAFAAGGEGTSDASALGEEHLSVPDPFGGDDGIYEETFKTLERYVNLAMERMAKDLTHPREGVGRGGLEEEPASGTGGEE